eukprot:CAMPEP_0181338236 /NCGR_PEP_ID=MMETSP1101-20121128/28530_1 /TAXON_ID=46948 /ORGANISM="Rhodomonas abbreviata, Strain Caron Lab Isolate" /LENGTH=342 /DNA_ID=CAMNT_0023448955 /DNA_START=146 /DNA_END=1171 /DNA_ORIENTATION=-
MVRELAKTKSAGNGEEVRTWDVALSVSGKSLDVVDRLVTLAQKHKLDPKHIRMSRIGAEDIHLSNLMTLRENRWVDSVGLNGLLQAIALQAPHICFGSNPSRHHTTWIADTFFYDKLTRVVRDEHGAVVRVDGYEYEQVARYVRKADLTSIRQVLIPINLNNTHWILARLDVKGKRVEILDSMHQLNPTVYVNMIRWMAETFGMNAGEITETSMLVDRQIIDDCGIFVGLGVIQQALGIRGRIPSSRMGELRALFAYVLLTGRVNTGYKKKARIRKPATRQEKVTEHVQEGDAWAELEDNPELLERYQLIAGDLLDRDDYSFERLNEEINKMGSMEKWCRKH